MLRIADRIMKTFSDVTLGTVIVLVHVALADRVSRTAPAPQRMMADGTRCWQSQISP
jgi:hypothetical protein